MKDKVHMGISIGQAFEDHDKIKQRYVIINQEIEDDIADGFDYKRAKYMINPGVYPMKPVKKIYGDIHKKILQDIEEDGINLGFVLGPKKAPGQIYRITDYKGSNSESQMNSETKDYSLMTNAMVYYDHGNNSSQMIKDDEDNTPKKLLKKRGK